MEETTSLAADLSAALGDTSPQDAGPVSEATPAPDSAPTGTATTQPAEATAGSPNTDQAQAQKPAGPIPFEDHKRTLENARTKTRAEVEAEWADYAWAKEVDREAVSKAVEIAQMFQSDKAAFVRQIMADESDPAVVAAVRSEAARLLSKGRGQQTGQPVDLTPIQIDLGNGQVVPFFTAEQFNAALDQRMAKLEQRFAPALTAAEKLRVQEENAAADQWSQGFLGEVKGYPSFEEHKADIKADVQRQIAAALKADPESVNRAFLEAAVLRSYHRIVTPTLHVHAKRAELTDQHSQAAASTVNPSRSGTAAPKSFEDMTLAEALAANVSV